MKEGYFYRSVKEHRKKVKAAKPIVKPLDISHRSLEIPLKMGNSIKTQIYRPKNIGCPYSTIIYIPGTAFIGKEIAFTEVICTHLVKQSFCQVISMEHGLAPEVPFPMGLNQAYEALVWILSEWSIKKLKIDKYSVVLIGYSSGGNFAASMAMRAKRDGLPITHQVLISPLVDLSRSLDQFKIAYEQKDTTITESFVQWFIKIYLPNKNDRQKSTASPFFQKKTLFQGLPPTIMVIAENDRFRSDGEAYTKKLNEAGVNNYKWIVPKVDHSFLWYRLDIIEGIGTRVKVILGLDSIPKNPYLKEKRELTKKTIVSNEENSVNPQALMI